jgi:hypothetical protein
MKTFYNGIEIIPILKAQLSKYLFENNVCELLKLIGKIQWGLGLVQW